MVAKVNSGRNIVGILNYNENKVREGMAKCIYENLFHLKVERLTFNDKLKVLDNLFYKNKRATTKAVHISLNFHESEELKKDILSEIASTYMEKIGFDNQPYLVYQHFDAAHPHVHILTTNIQSNGKRIDIHNIGRNQSEKARKEIEILFDLVKAESKKKNEEHIKPIDTQRAIYGKSATKRSISNAVRMIYQNYKYTTLPEYNAALRQFNVVADRGKEGTNMHKKKGLQYSLLDEKGNKIGIPIKASSIESKPTLQNLEKQFIHNEPLRQAYKDRLRECIDHCIKDKTNITPFDFGEALHKEDIYVLLRQSNEGKIYGITYVDNQTKTVFNGSDLGKPYTAKSILEKITDTPTRAEDFYQSPKKPEKPGNPIELNRGLGEIIKDLTTAQRYDHTSPDAAVRRRKRKKKRKAAHFN